MTGATDWAGAGAGVKDWAGAGGNEWAGTRAKCRAAAEAWEGSEAGVGVEAGSWGWGRFCEKSAISGMIVSEVSVHEIEIIKFKIKIWA